MVDTADYNKLVIKMDGSYGLTTRNRRYVKPIVPLSSPKITVSDPIIWLMLERMI